MAKVHLLFFLFLFLLILLSQVPVKTVEEVERLVDASICQLEVGIPHTALGPHLATVFHCGFKAEDLLNARSGDEPSVSFS